MRKQNKSLPPKFCVWKWIDDNYITHRLIIVFTLWLTYHVIKWAETYVLSQSGADGMSLGATIGAITAPVTALQGWVFKIYSDRKNTITRYQNEEQS